jgi:hypothetical protein
MARQPDLHIGARVVPGGVVPEPANPTEWLLVGRALIAQVRSDYGLPAGANTLAVGWTNVEGLEARRFVGASRALRARAAVPHPTPHLQAPRCNHLFLDHAEQDVGNAFLDALGQARAEVRDGDWLRIFVSHGSGPCGACSQGLGDRQVEPGVLGQLSQRHAGLTITVGWPRAGGQLGFMILQDGARL